MKVPKKFTGAGSLVAAKAAEAAVEVGVEVVRGFDQRATLREQTNAIVRLKQEDRADAEIPAGLLRDGSVANNDEVQVILAKTIREKLTGNRS